MNAVAPPSPRNLIARARREGRESLTEPDAKALLAGFGVAVPRSAFLRPDEPPGLQIAGMRAPFALKIVAPGLLHKSDVGGVRLGLVDAAAIRAAMDAMLAAPAILVHAPRGFLLEEMAPPGHEIVIGATLHPQFGAVLMLGMGGIHVETLGDVTFRLCPLTRDDAVEMLAELRGIGILRGARGGIVADEARIVETLLLVGGEGGVMDVLAGEIAELDVNPLIVDRTRALAVDARIVLTPGRSGG